MLQTRGDEILRDTSKVWASSRICGEGDIMQDNTCVLQIMAALLVLTPVWSHVRFPLQTPGSWYKGAGCIAKSRWVAKRSERVDKSLRFAPGWEKRVSGEELWDGSCSHSPLSSANFVSRQGSRKKLQLPLNKQTKPWHFTTMLHFITMTPFPGGCFLLGRVEQISRARPRAASWTIRKDKSQRFLPAFPVRSNGNRCTPPLLILAVTSKSTRSGEVGVLLLVVVVVVMVAVVVGEFRVTLLVLQLKYLFPPQINTSLPVNYLQLWRGDAFQVSHLHFHWVFLFCGAFSAPTPPLERSMATAPCLLDLHEPTSSSAK